jgi:tRNA dimethylallyltransferase
MQIYKGMNIGTAKPTHEEMSTVVHHLVDIASPSEPFSAKDYRDAAIPVADEISKRGAIPLFVGGTGLYLDTLMRGDMSEVPEASVEYRDAILATIKNEQDKIALHQRLYEVDPISAEKIHHNNVRRIIRAIEIYEKTGKPKSYFDELSRSNSGELNILHITLDFQNRDLLYERIDKRTDLMFEMGLVQEVSALLSSGELPKDSTAAQAIGYKEIAELVERGESAEGAREVIKQASRNYAKRQLTWFRHTDAKVLFADNDGRMKTADELLSEASDIIREFLKNET